MGRLRIVVRSQSLLSCFTSPPALIAVGGLEQIPSEVNPLLPELGQASEGAP